jgi:hypothetical protein
MYELVAKAIMIAIGAMIILGVVKTIIIQFYKAKAQIRKAQCTSVEKNFKYYTLEGNKRKRA